VRYQAALRPDICCFLDFKPLSQFPIRFRLPKSAQKSSHRGKNVTKPHQLTFLQRHSNAWRPQKPDPFGEGIDSGRDSRGEMLKRHVTLIDLPEGALALRGGPLCPRTPRS
jgi:hypothetical protein